MVANEKETIVVLVDNGSIRNHAILYTRKMAEMLSSTIGCKVLAASIAHSDRVSPDRLNGVKAQLIQPLLRELIVEHLYEQIVILPFMLVDQGAIFFKLKALVDEIAQVNPQKHVFLCNPLISETDGVEYALSGLIAGQIERVLKDDGSDEKQDLLIVDHGSPYRNVAEVRNRIGKEVGNLLAGRVGKVVVCSLERRIGEQYSFNEPLLERALRELVAEGSKTVIVSRLFLLPGKHSGKGGDIDQICSSIDKSFPEVRILHAPRVFSQKKLIYVLLRRLEEMSNEDACLK